MMLSIIGLIIGLYLSLYALPLIPHLIESLSNDPNRNRKDAEIKGIKPEDITYRDYKPNKSGFFTYIRPGQVKIIERGKRFIRCIMAYSHYMFIGERKENDYTQKHEEYWEVVSTRRLSDGKILWHDSHPLPFPMPKLNIRWWWIPLPLNIHWWLWCLCSWLSVPWWLWKRWVYKTTGAVFTGIPPFQTVRVYPMERFKRVTGGTADDSKINLVRVEDYSDQYRVAHFQYPLLLSTATQGMVFLKVLINTIDAVFNPYMVAYNTDDDWPTRFLGSISNRVTLFTRGKPLDQILTANNPKAAAELASFINQGGEHVTEEDRLAGKKTPEGSTCDMGIKIMETQVLSISPLIPSDTTELGKEARAIVQRKADEQLAKGKAAYIREEGDALKDHPYAEVVVRTQGLVQAAEAAGKAGGIVILGGQTFDPAQAAILQELRKQRGQKGKT
jgi:hypothetical protein